MSFIPRNVKLDMSGITFDHFLRRARKIARMKMQYDNSRIKAFIRSHIADRPGPGNDSSIRKLADHLGMKPSTLRGMANDDNNPRIDKLYEFATATKTPLSEWLGEVPEGFGSIPIEEWEDLRLLRQQIDDGLPEALRKDQERRKHALKAVMHSFLASHGLYSPEVQSLGEALEDNSKPISRD